MLSDTVDLYSVRFWAAVAVAVAMMVPLAAGSARRVVFAAFNLAFLGLYLRGGMVGLVAGVVVAWLVLRALPMPRLGPLALALGGSAVLGLFLLHKLPGLGSGTLGGRLNPILTVVG